MEAELGKGTNEQSFSLYANNVKMPWVVTESSKPSSLIQIQEKGKTVFRIDMEGNCHSEIPLDEAAKRFIEFVTNGLQTQIVNTITTEYKIVGEHGYEGSCYPTRAEAEEALAEDVNPHPVFGEMYIQEVTRGK